MKYRFTHDEVVSLFPERSIEKELVSRLIHTLRFGGKVVVDGFAVDFEPDGSPKNIAGKIKK